MATLVFTAIGTAIGGPIGGAIGAFVGGQVDDAVFGSGSREGPRLKELSVTTSSYGQPLPRHFGRMRVAGTVIWSTELIESSSREGGGKGQPSVTTFSYSASFAVALGSSQISRVGRIWADGNLLRGAGGDLKVEGEMRTYLGTGDNPVDPLIAADRGGASPGFRDCAYVVFEDLQLGDFGNRIPALTFEVFAPEDSTVTLTQIVPQGTSISTPTVLENVRGYSDEGGPLESSLSAIDRVFPLTCVTTQSGIGLSSTIALPSHVESLSERLSDTDGADAEESHKRRGETTGREPLALRYYDEDRDYQPGVQRALGPRPDGREVVVDLPAAMTATGARELANLNAHRARWHDERIVWRTGELNPDIGPGSIVKIPETSGFWLVRSWEWYERGIELTIARVAPKLDPEDSSDPGFANLPIDLAAPPTILGFFEVPPGDTTDTNSPTLIASASSVDGGWSGATLYLEQGSSLSEIGKAGRQRATTGELVAPLGPSTGMLLEPSATLEVELKAADFGYSSTDVTGLAMGTNRLLVGGEVIQFLTAERMSGNYWKLSGLLRGRAGSEDAAQIGHEAGVDVLSLDGHFTAVDPALVPAEAGVRIAAIGRGDLEPAFAEIQNPGLSRQPLIPVRPRANHLADGSIQLCWTRRARGQWRWPIASEVPLIEEQESYLAGFGPVDNPWSTWTTFAPELSISQIEKEELTTSFGNGPLWVRQIGTFGQSRALLLTNLD